MRINSHQLKIQREAKSWSQEELAIAADLSVRTIQRAESQGSASMQSLKSMAAALDLQLDDLREQESTDKPNNYGVEEINQPPPIFLSLKWRMFGLIAIVVVIVGVPIWQHQQSEITITEDEWALLPLEEKVLGYWESYYLGDWRTLNLDGTSTNPGGSVVGNSPYTIRDNIISYNYRTAVRSSYVEFRSPTEMVWRSIDNGAIVVIFHREAPPPLSNAELADKMIGDWRFEDEDGYMTITPDQVTIQYPDGSLIKSRFNTRNNLIFINSPTGNMISYAINFHPDGVMTWLVPNTNNEMRLRKVKSGS